MSQKIEQETVLPVSRPEFEKGFLWKLGLTTILILLLVGVGNYIVDNFQSHGIQLTYPWVIAGSVTIGNGLSRFSYEAGGKEPTPLPSALHAWPLASVLILYVITPTMFLFGWRRNRIRSKEPREPLRVLHVLYIAAAIPVVITAISVIPMTYIHEEVRSSLREAQAVQEQKDFIINELNLIKNRAIEYTLLPKQFNGGDGSFNGYVIPQELQTTPQSMYVSTVKADTLFLEARSVMYPESTVKVKIRIDGTWFDWEYEGKLL
ncbi:MAG: hypothetical protein V1799_06540 [bacterium]